MDTTATYLDAFLVRMKTEGLPELAIRSFAYYYKQLVAGETGLMGEDDISPVVEIPDYEKLDEAYAAIGHKELPKTALLKLNGGLGTSMGLKGAKSLLPVRGDLTFLDIIAQQAIHWDISLLLMNSFSTVSESRKKLAEYALLRNDVPQDFEQHKIPKVSQETLEPVQWPAEPALEWCPPGHGDIYTALVTTGTLEALLDAGIKYVFVSNSDNLGAVYDPLLLGYFAKHNLPFMMEVADRTESDKKGGHLALDNEGNFVLRESAQCPVEDINHFQNIDRHKFFNTNNLWVNLEALRDILKEKDGILGLPMIRNSKTVDSRLHDSTPVYQLETAMGAAIAVFEGAGAVRVPRNRFAPVKTTNQLLAVQSDAYIMQSDHTLTLHPGREEQTCVIHLDKLYYSKVDDLAKRFPYGAPSLLHNTSFQVFGDVHFGRNVVCKGDVTIKNMTEKPVFIEDNAVLEGELVFD